MTDLDKTTQVFLDRVTLVLKAEGITTETLTEQAINQAMQTVIERDEQLWLLLTGDSDEAKLFRQQMSSQVYRLINTQKEQTP